MKKINEKTIKKELIKIINKQHIDEIIYEPRYYIGYEESRVVMGSIITIRTTYKNGQKRKR